jgi:hypothetical protein
MKSITKMAVPRRTVLRGLGATAALPLLDAMVPAFTTTVKTAAAPTKRFEAVYVPNGMAMDYWTPATTGAGFEFSPIAQPLAPFREHVLVISGLDLPGAFGSHPSAYFLNGVVGNRGENDIRCGATMDQIVAKEYGQHTQLASLELSIENVGNTGQCTGGYSCVYSNTIAWRDATTPLTPENNPRAVFERMFGDSDSTSAAARQARVAEQRSVLDVMLEAIAGLKKKIGPQDRSRMEQYLEAVRDVERRLQRAEEQADVELPLVEKPVGIPATYPEHVRLMFDLQLLAYQTDLTRISTFMLGREQSSLTYLEVGVPESHHPLSHHAYQPERIASLAKINTYHATLFAEHVAKLKATPDGDGTLLDHTMILYGSAISNSMEHFHTDLPLALVGGGGGTLRGGRHLRYPAKTPMSNLMLTLMDKLGVKGDHLGDSTGLLDIDSTVTL